MVPCGTPETTDSHSDGEPFKRTLSMRFVKKDFKQFNNLPWTPNTESLCNCLLR